MKSTINPFVGLKSFEDCDSHLFFGRDNQIKNVITNLKNTGFTTIIGSSGSGKSSLIKSGIIPAIERGALKGEGNGWKIGLLNPGSDPIGNLSACLSSGGFINNSRDAKNSNLKKNILNILKTSKDGISAVFKDSRNENPQNVLLIIDQFEEIFTFANNENGHPTRKEDSSLFINLLLNTISEKRIYIALSMRSDYLENCTHFSGLPEALNKGHYLIPRTTRDELKQIITKPIEFIKAKISPSLLDLLLNHIDDNQDLLPVLQHGLMRVVGYWQRESKSQGIIDVEHYNAIGTLDKALSNHADEAYTELKTEENKIISELIFKSLAEKGPNSKGIRRPCKVIDLMEELNVSEKKIIEIVDVFRIPGRSFLTPPISQNLTKEDFIDISHESLMRVWGRLKLWLKEEADSSRIYLKLCKAAALYQEGKGSLLTNPELEVVLLWKERTKPNERWGMRYDTSFVRGMNFLNQSKENFEFLILQKEIAQKNKIRRTKIFSIVVSFAFIIAMGLGLYSYSLYNEAAVAKEKAESSEVAAKNSASRATESAKAANNEREKAQKATLLAKQSDSAAQSSRDQAIKQKNIATKAAKAAKTAENEEKLSANKAKESANKAKESANRAKESAISADKQRKKAILAKDEADKLKNVAQSIQEAFQSMNSLDAKNYKKGIDLALKAHKKFTSNSNQKRNSDIYLALNRSLVEGKDFGYYSHAHGIKKVTTNTKLKKTAFIDMKGDCFLNSDENMRSFHKVADINLEENENVSCLSFSSTGEYLILGTKTGELKVLNTKSEIAVFNAQISDNEISSIHSATINSINYLFVLEGNKYHLMRLNNGKIKVEDSLELPIQNFTKDYVNASFSKIIIANGSQAIMYSIAIEKQGISILKINEIKTSNKITSIEMSSNGNYLALGMNNGWLRLETLDKNMNSKNSKIIKSHKSKVSDLKFIINKEESLLISSSYDNTLNMVNMLNTSDIIVLKGHKGWIHQLTLSSDNKHIISVSEDRSLKKWFVYENDIVKLLNKN
jgi:WD40 repeat protein/energy-coupling factor transporter ATP-binding protein EcfA2